MQIASSLCCIILSPVACLALPYFTKFSHTMQDFGEKFTEYKKCDLIFSTTFVQKLSHSKNNSLKQDYKCPYILHVSYLLFLSDFNKTLILLTDFQEVITYKIS